ncbi:Two-pore potassium channel 5 [Heracleum sosnowskyi]|uniref:Two-pore potassium channel 5 n=1 Tax=Heracleum sosnowskyi TaxID=360622 RepID=A0AAD8GZ71_9APIA|nr:Two-pore potassium channel 5 [Heracleum sosnowskyi]
MEEQSFLIQQQLIQTLLNYNQDYTSNTTSLNTNQDLENPSSVSSNHHDSDDHNSILPTIPLFLNSSKNRKTLHRCRSSPALTVMHDTRENVSKPVPSSASLVKQAALLLIVYLFLGVLIYAFNRDHFSGIETNPFIDAIYFCIVTMCTIGYGDIAPSSAAAKIFACLFVLVGFGFIDILLSGVVNYVLDLQENMILTGIEENSVEGFSVKNYIYDKAKGRMRIRLKVGLAIGVVFCCIGFGSVVLYYMEELSVIDSFYLSVMSVTTVGYGDRAFKSPQGRLFASVWLLFSTLAVARAFLYLAEARIDKRHRRIAKWVLHREITVEDLVAADLNHNGFISKSEYVVYKLKEMGKIGEKDVLQICDQFNKLDRNNSGKLTLPDLLGRRL